jgi:peptide-methionine (R)-S-oxide reductase
MRSNINKRDLLIGSLTGTASVMALAWGLSGKKSFANEVDFEITKTKEEWRAQLSEIQFQVLRKEDTERPFTSPLNDEKRTGLFHCAGCDLPLYDSKTKFDSGTGWPSFYEALENAVGTREDNSFFMKRTEVHCRRCGGHQGHIFDDGPPPTGKRHCINGVSLKFVPA